MKKSNFNHLLFIYIFWYEQFEISKKNYEKIKAEYRVFAEADNQIGKPGHHLPYEPPLTMMRICDIRKNLAQKCKEAKEEVKEIQRIFNNTRIRLEKTLQENGLVLY